MLELSSTYFCPRRRTNGREVTDIRWAEAHCIFSIAC